MRQQKRVDTKNYLAENDNEEVPPPMLWDAFKTVTTGKIIALIKKTEGKQLDQLQTDFKTLENAY